jgi:uncharacterized delta-60 repeat protein
VIRTISKMIVAVVYVASFGASASPGSLDTSFGIGGVVTTTFAGGSAIINGLAVQPDGDIVAAGYVQQGSTEHAVVARYLANGVLDSSFGTAGITLSPTTSAFYSAIVLQPDGKIVTAGELFGPIEGSIAVTRYLADGRLDTQFGANGTATMSNSSRSLAASSLALQSDGKIVVGGQAQPSGSDMLVARFNSDGTPDATFGTGGIIGVTGSSLSTYSNAVAIQSDGKIVAAGSAGLGVFGLSRFNANGSPDDGFGSGGMAIFPASVPTNGGVRAVALSQDGLIEVAGYFLNAGASDVILMRFMANGTADQSFGVGGVAQASINTIDYGFALCLQPDGTSVLAGSTTTLSSPYDVLLAAFTRQGQLEASFAHSGIATTSVLGDQEGVAVACLANKIIVGGYTSPIGGNRSLLLLQYVSANDLLPPPPAPVPGTSREALLFMSLLILAIAALLKLDTRNRVR